MSESKKRKEVVSNLRSLTKEELKAKTQAMEEEVFGLILKHRTGQLKTTADIKVAKKNLARVKTLITEKSVQEAKS